MRTWIELPDDVRSMRVLIVALSTYTSGFNRARLPLLAGEVGTLHVLAGDVETMWGRGQPVGRGAPYRLDLVPVLSRWPALMALREVAPVMAELRPHLVHVEAEPWQAATVQAVSAARRYGARVGVSFAENGPALRGIDGAARRVVARRVLRRCDYAVGWADGSTSVARRLGGPSLRTATIPGTGIDLDGVASVHPEADRWFPAEGGRRVAFAARLEPTKGVADVLATCDDLHRLSGVQVALVGRGSLEPTVRRFAASRPWATFHGVLERSEVLSLFASADVCLAPTRTTSRYAEQFGKAVVEAMAVGTPVVAYDCGSLREVVGAGGLVVREGDRAGLLAAAHRVLAEDAPSRARRRGAALAQAARFDERRLSQDLTELWREVAR